MVICKTEWKLRICTIENLQNNTDNLQNGEFAKWQLSIFKMELLFHKFSLSQNIIILSCHSFCFSPFPFTNCHKPIVLVIDNISSLTVDHVFLWSIRP